MTVVAQLGKAMTQLSRKTGVPCKPTLRCPRYDLLSWTPAPHHLCILALLPLSHSLAMLGGPLLAPAGFYSHGRKVCLSTVEEPSLVCHQKLQAQLSGDQEAVQVTQDRSSGQILPICFC